MKNLLLGIAAVIFLLTILHIYNKPNTALIFSSADDSIQLNVSAALGLKEALLDIQKDYEAAHSNVKIIYNLAAAGILQSQIEHGAPADIFISAASQQIDALTKQGLVDTSTRKNIVSNDLVLIVPKDSSLEVTSFNDLAKDNLTSCGIGEPQTVPAGQYSMEVLKHLGLWETVKNKAVLAKDVRTILSYVETGNTDAGIVFSTVAATSSKITIISAAPKDSHEPIVFPGVVLANSKHHTAAQDFLNYINSPAGMKIFQKYGFQTAN